MSIQNAWNEALRAVHAGVSLYAFSPEVQEQVKIRKESEQAAKHGQAHEELKKRASKQRVEEIFKPRNKVQREYLNEEIEPNEMAFIMEDYRKQEEGLEGIISRSLNEQSAAAIRQYELTGDEEALEKYINLEQIGKPTAEWNREMSAARERGRQERYQRDAQRKAKEAEESLQDEYERILESNERLEQQIAYLKSEQKMKHTRHKGRTLGGDN